MLKKNIISVCAVLIIFITTVVASAQQTSLATLIVTSFNGASQGFSSLIKDTVPDFGGWNYKIRPEVVQQFAGVKDIKIRYKKNYKSALMNDNRPVQINQMLIRSDNIGIPEGKTWNDYKDTLTSYYNRQVDFFKKAFSSQLNTTNIIPLEEESQFDFKPRYLIYFYSKTLTIPESMTNKNEIEKLLDVTGWFSVELQEYKLGLAHYFNVQYRISGGQRQAEQ